MKFFYPAEKSCAFGVVYCCVKINFYMSDVKKFRIFQKIFKNLLFQNFFFLQDQRRSRFNVQLDIFCASYSIGFIFHAQPCSWCSQRVSNSHHSTTCALHHPFAWVIYI
jgi:hypothetical protein